MFCYDGLEPEHRKRPQINTVLDAFVDTIRSLPRRRDNRSEPILEPHYKLASVVHKLVVRGYLTTTEAFERLRATSYAQKIPPPEGLGDWKRYILDVLKRMRSADKSNWHHRMPLRAAHIIYDSSKDETAASEAKAELTQHVFTKIMTLQVWRPENERAGRHFVYTTRYVRFFVNLLNQLNDKYNIELIAKRVRRKASDFADHTGLWKFICETYIQIMRRCEDIPLNADSTIFKTVTLDDFQSTASTTEKYYLSHLDSPLMGVLRDAAELKKLNSGLMKAPIIEDLVVDTYGVMYGTVVRKTMEEAVQQETRERMRVDHLLEGDKPLDVPSDPAPEDAPTPNSKAKSAKLVTRKDIVRRAEALLALASRPPVHMQKLDVVAIPYRPMAPSTALGPLGISIEVEQDSTIGSVNATDDEDSELSELGKSPEPPKSVSSLQDLLQGPNPSANSTSNSLIEEGDERAVPDATAQVQDSATNDNTSSDIEID
ncbi:Histone transcription regulator 3 [Ascosphaera pollenicola]|nr:Histone transcription regulator 3 [Ascosphaera pollenicola]